MASEALQNTGDSVQKVIDPSTLWKTKDGILPLFDDPTITQSAHRWTEPPRFDLNMTRRRISYGEIGSDDLALGNLLISWRCVTERQLRILAEPLYGVGHKVGKRIRVLQKIGWTDGFVIDASTGHREHIWMYGIPAYQFYQICMGAEIEDPFTMLTIRGYALSICAINEFRFMLEQRGHVPEIHYSPVWRKGDPTRPFCQVDITVKSNPLTIYIERIMQKNEPLRRMRVKLDMYDQMFLKNNALLGPDGRPAMVVWSVGSIEAIESLVGSIDYWPDSFLQVFLVDEFMDSFPNSFYLAKKGRKLGEVILEKINMDLF
jgi:hypothetical protein